VNIRIEKVAPFIQVRPTVVASNDRAPSLSCSPLRSQSSEIRTGCANERPSGSGEGVASNRDPYSDLMDCGFECNRLVAAASIKQQRYLRSSERSS